MAKKSLPSQSGQSRTGKYWDSAWAKAHTSCRHPLRTRSPCYGASPQPTSPGSWRSLCHQGKYEVSRIGCFKAGQLDLQLMPQLNPNSISQFPNLARVGVQVGVAALNAFYFHAISTATQTSNRPQLHLFQVTARQQQSTSTSTWTPTTRQPLRYFSFFSLLLTTIYE